MRLLIAYDGSNWAESALQSLRTLGMPPRGDALVLHVDEESQPDEATIAEQGASIARHLLPSGWTIRSSCMHGPVVDLVLRHADEWKADLLHVGSHGHSGIKHAGLGGVAQQLIQHAPCSVRIGRSLPHPRRQQALRLMLAVDGSRDGDAAVHCILNRDWLTGTRVRIACVRDSSAPASNTVRPAGSTDFCPKQILQSAARQLTLGHLDVDTVEYEGDPATVLLDEAVRSFTDCIFLGATGQSGWRPSAVGCVTAQVLLSAACSVEVCRCYGASHVGDHSANAVRNTVQV